MEWTDLGVGGVIVILVVREMFSFLRSRNGNSDRSILQRQSTILSRIVETQEKIVDCANDLVTEHSASRERDRAMLDSLSRIEARQR